MSIGLFLQKSGCRSSSSLGIWNLLCLIYLFLEQFIDGAIFIAKGHPFTVNVRPIGSIVAHLAYYLGFLHEVLLYVLQSAPPRFVCGEVVGVHLFKLSIEGSI